MASEQHTDYQALIEKLQNDIEGLKAQLFYLVNTKSEFAHPLLEEAMRLELQQMKEQFNEILTEQFVGMVCAFAMPEPPLGWLECNGQAVSRTEYARLFSKIGTTFGTGDDGTTFNLPDLMGVFVRGWERFTGGHDPGRRFGSYQSDQLQTHSHTDSGHNHSGTTNHEGNHSHQANTSSEGNHHHKGKTTADYTYRSWSEIRNALEKLRSDKNRPTGLRKTEAVPNVFFPESEIYWDGSHEHVLETNSVGIHAHRVEVSSTGSHSHAVSTDDGQAHLSNPTYARHGQETCPKNIALLFCIKY